MMNQQTISKAATISGIGLHSGKQVNVTLLPAAVNHGIVFRRVDLPNSADIKIAANKLTNTQLCSVIGNNSEVTVSTIEHLMAALCGLQIDNIIVEVNAPELPILDGSSTDWVELLDKAGRSEQHAPRQYLTITKTTEIKDGARHLTAEPANDFIIEIEVDFDHDHLPALRKTFTITEQTFREQIAAARTFCLENDIERMRKANLIKGGSLDCAVVYGENGPLNPEGLRFSDEHLRHKLLDAIGDLYLTGHQPRGKFTLIHPGHQMNNQLLCALAQ